MTNNLFVLVMLWGVGCLMANSGPAYGADTAPAIKSNATGSSEALEMRRAPVPLVKEITTTLWSPAPTVEPASKLTAAATKPTGGSGAEEPPARDALLAEGAAKAAVEADGSRLTKAFTDHTHHAFCCRPAGPIDRGDHNAIAGHPFSRHDSMVVRQRGVYNGCIAPPERTGKLS